MAITRTRATTELHINSVMNDPEYLAEHKKVIKHRNKSKLLPILLKKYGLELDDFNFFNRNNGFALFINPDTMFSAGNLEYIMESHEFIARFDETVRKEQFHELWKLVQRNKKRIGVKETKLKLPQDSDLLYAIFKGRQNGREFKKIFDDYKGGVLSYYSGNHKTFDNEYDLEKYYFKHYKLKL